MAPPPPARLPWFQEFEQTWLDPVARPLPELERLLGWAPDPFDAYCERCGRDVGAYEVTEFGCARCRDRRLRWSRWVRLGRYEAPLSKWVCEVKFSRFKRRGLQLGARLGERVGEALRQEGVKREDVVVVPVPTNPWRRMVRGLDHTDVLSQGVKDALHVPLRRALRTRLRPSQRGRSATERLSNLRGSMRLASLRVAEELAGRVVVLVDDVSTTGATIREASRALLEPFRAKPGGKAAGPRSLWVATVAVTSDRGVGGHAAADARGAESVES